MKKMVEKLMGRIEELTCNIFISFGELSIKQCCILTAYEVEIPEELYN